MEQKRQVKDPFSQYFIGGTVIIILLLALLLSSFTAQAQAPTMQFEINLALKQQTGEYHPPYVAAWIENSQRQSVRTLFLWRKEAKWLKDIRRWWRNAGRKDSQLVDAITSATHAAGKYPLSFNATNDNQQPLANDNYTLYIEVVREKGGRALIKQAFQFKQKNQTFTLSETPETDEITFSIIQKDS